MRTTRTAVVMLVIRCEFKADKFPN